MGWSRRQTGTIYYETGRAYRGYTIFAPNGGDDMYLIDLEGRGTGPAGSGGLLLAVRSVKLERLLESG